MAFAVTLLFAALTVFFGCLRWRAVVLERRLGCLGIPPDLPLREYSAFANLDGLRVHYQEAGRGEPLVLIHGFGASTICWSFVLRQLARSSRVIALDLKGFGLTACPRDRAYSLRSHANVVAQLLDNLGVSGATICGNSLGGAVALWLALIRPDLVARLALLDAAVQAGTRQKVLMRILRVPLAGELLSLILLAGPSIVEYEMNRVYHIRSTTVTTERIALYHRPLSTAGRQYGALSTLRSWKLVELHGHLNRVTQPALLLWGANDRIVPLRIGKELATRLPHAELHVLQDCGHSPEEEHPDLVVELIQQFISQQRRSALLPTAAVEAG